MLRKLIVIYMTAINNIFYYFLVWLKKKLQNLEKIKAIQY